MHVVSMLCFVGASFESKPMVSSKRFSTTLLFASSILCGRKRATRIVAFCFPEFVQIESANPLSRLRNIRPLRMNYATPSGTSSCAALFGSLTIAQFPCLSDNYGYLIHDVGTGQTAAIDTPDGKSYKAELAKRGWELTHIFNTHHHWDHTGGNMDLKTDKVAVYGPALEESKIPGITNILRNGEEIVFGSSRVQIMDVGGHTRGHIAYYFPDEKIIFVGDSLFALGCGRMFEGTAAQFWTSLKSLRDLPDETTVYCAHEYTESNAKFAASIEPGNTELMARVTEIYNARKRGEFTVPTNLGLEKRTNPFLRCDISSEIQKNVGVVAGDSDADAFGKVRSAKDNFRS